LERLTVKYFGNAKRYAVRTLQNMGVMEKAEDADEVCLFSFSSLRFVVSLTVSGWYLGRGRRIELTLESQK
jgi:hypothetical protein